MQEDFASPGRALMTLLFARAHERGQSQADLAQVLGITQSYLSQLRGGQKPVARMSDAVLARCTTYLHLPRILGLLLAGRVQMEDFFTSPEVGWQSALESALRALSDSRHAHEAAVDMPMLLELPRPIQHLLAVLFERAEGLAMLPGRISTDTMANWANQQLPFCVQRNRAI